MVAIWHSGKPNSRNVASRKTVRLQKHVLFGYLELITKILFVA